MIGGGVANACIGAKRLRCPEQLGSDSSVPVARRNPCNAHQ
jgi:hypothetical protein